MVAFDVLGYFKDAKIKQGYAAATAITLSSVTYLAHTADAGNGGGTVYRVASSTQYQNDDGSGQEATNYSSTWFSNAAGTTTRLLGMTMQRPTIPDSQNGPGTSGTETTVFDSQG